MQINAVCSIFCLNQLKKSSNHEALIEKYHECVQPIMNARMGPSELKRISKIYGRPLIKLSNSLQTELKMEANSRTRHTLVQIAFLTNQCLIKLQSILKMRAWAIERMWNGFVCRAVSFKLVSYILHCFDPCTNR